MRETAPPCPAGLRHFFSNGKCVICDTLLPCCKNCVSCWTSLCADGRTIYHCGHGVDDSSLGSASDTNPEWANIKHNQKNLFGVIQGKPELPNSDCETLHPDFGRRCPVFSFRETA